MRVTRERGEPIQTLLGRISSFHFNRARWQPRSNCSGQNYQEDNVLLL